MPSWWPSLITLLPLLCSTVNSQSTQQACNNFPDLCDRSYANVTQLGAHNSPFTRDGLNGLEASGNHDYNSTVQLEAGVRLLTAQVHRENNTLQLCHSNCLLLDAGPLRTWLTSIVDWLASNPDNVVSVLLVNADGASTADLEAEYTASGADTISYTPPPPGPADGLGVVHPWPTLRELVGNSTRLVSFVADRTGDDDATAPYLLDSPTYLFENPFRNVRPVDLARPCTLEDPARFEGNAQAALSQGLLPTMNHFLYNDSLSLLGRTVLQPDEGYANITNGLSGSGVGNLGDKSQRCTVEWGRAPWAVVVDFFDRGAAVEAVDLLNGVSGPVGRRTVGEIIQQGGGGRSRPRVGMMLAIVVVMMMFGLAGWI